MYNFSRDFGSVCVGVGVSFQRSCLEAHLEMLQGVQYQMEIPSQASWLSWNNDQTGDPDSRGLYKIWPVGTAVLWERHFFLKKNIFVSSFGQKKNQTHNLNRLLVWNSLYKRSCIAFCKRFLIQVKPILVFVGVGGKRDCLPRPPYIELFVCLFVLILCFLFCFVLFFRDKTKQNRVFL